MVRLVGRSISETRRVRYLLGLCSQAERERIESEYFEDDAAFQEMLTAEDDLIDAYAHGELAHEERRRFERSFVSSLRGKERVKFARAFAGAISITKSVQPKLPDRLTNIFKNFQSLRTATIAAVIVFVAVLALLATDRRRITNELRELREQSAELSKRTEALQRSSDTERTRSAEIGSQRTNLQSEPDKPKHPELETRVTQPARHLREVKHDCGKPNHPERLINTEDGPLADAFGLRPIIAKNKPEKTESLINAENATLSNPFTRQMLTELPITERKVANLLTLQPTTTRDGYAAGVRADQANITLDGVESESLNTFALRSRIATRNGETTIQIPSSLSWIRFQITLETAAIHEDYRITIKTADGRRVTSVDWTEPRTPNQTIIDTPVISTRDLSAGDYVLVLMGKVADGSFVEVAKYSFKVIKH